MIMRALDTQSRHEQFSRHHGGTRPRSVVQSARCTNHDPNDLGLSSAREDAQGLSTKDKGEGRNGSVYDQFD